MTDGQHSDKSRSIIDIINDAIVAYSDTVVTDGPMHSPRAGRTRLGGESIDTRTDPLPHVVGEAAELSPSRGAQLHRIAHDNPSSALTCSHGTESPGSRRAFSASTES